MPMMMYDHVNNNATQYSKVSVPFTKLNAEKCVLREIFIAGILFR